MESIIGKMIASYVKTAILLVSCSILAGCATTQPLYYWGDYETIIYEMYIEPGSADPTTQIQKLTQDISEASAEGKRIPPGVHAHLGYMFFLQGNRNEAVLEFETEKKLFPESAIFVDGLMGRKKK